MAFELRKATPDDASALTHAFFDAFCEHPASLRVIKQSSEAGNRYFVESMNAELRDSNAHFIVAVDPASAYPGGIVGWAKWVQPLTPTSPARPSQLPWPEDADLAFADEFFGCLERKHSEHMQDRPHWYLELLGVRKSHQRKGLGKRLLRWGLQRADEDQVEAFLSASPFGAPMYTKHGFETVETLHFDEGKYAEKIMVRQPKEMK
ncbi:acyl-CoA N-acyltransferase [Xylariomycetidae sp. FL0641]|nr:acyl-CoA N-acyltransferase [Xylariomycetidae sp. FL0641]